MLQCNPMQCTCTHTHLWRTLNDAKQSLKKKKELSTSPSHFHNTKKHLHMLRMQQQQELEQEHLHVQHEHHHRGQDSAMQEQVHFDWELMSELSALVETVRKQSWSCMNESEVIWVARFECPSGSQLFFFSFFPNHNKGCAPLPHHARGKLAYWCFCMF